MRLLCTETKFELTRKAVECMFAGFDKQVHA